MKKNDEKVYLSIPCYPYNNYYFKSMKPKFKHDCENCRFLGHYYDFDVYICDNLSTMGQSLIARYSDEGCEYFSQPSKILLSLIERNGKVGLSSGDRIDFQNHLIQEKEYQAILLALAVDKLKNG